MQPEPKRNEPAKEPQHKSEAPRGVRIDVHSREDPGPDRFWWYVGVGVIVLILVVLFLIIPGVKGYKAYRAMQQSGVPETYVTNMAKLIEDKQIAEAKQAALETERNVALADAQQSLETLSSCQNNIDTCKSEAASQKKQCDALIDSFSKDADTLKSDLATCQQEVKTAADKTTAVISDAARRLCCVQRVENPASNSYAVVESRIVCVQDGGKPITC